MMRYAMDDNCEILNHNINNYMHTCTYTGTYVCMYVGMYQLLAKDSVCKRGSQASVMGLTSDKLFSSKFSSLNKT